MDPEPDRHRWSDERLVGLLDDVADAVIAALDDHRDWGPSGRRAGQYASDVVADAAANDVLDAAGVGVLSEESGTRRLDEDVVVVIDPLDGSTNASRGIPWYATSLCALDASGPRVALVVNLASGRRFGAVRGGGATCDGRPLTPSAVAEVGDAFVGLSGMPAQHLGWRQFRALGAVALDLCAVAEGVLDGYVDCSADAHGSWDYLAGMLICTEAGAHVADALGRDLVVLDHAGRRTPVAAGTGELLDGLVRARGELAR